MTSVLRFIVVPCAMAPGGERWAIERIMRGDGKIVNNIRYYRNQYYGSSRLSGGREHFHPIEINSLIIRPLKIAAPPAGKLPSKTRSENAVSSPAGRRNKRKFRKGSGVKTLAEVKTFCRANPGVPLVIGGPGARGDIEGVHGYYAPESEVTRGHPYMHSQDGDCVHAALVNAVGILCGHEAAQRAEDFMQQNLNFIPSLRKLTAVVLQLGCHVELRRVPKDERQGIASNPFEWVASRKQGVMLVRLEQAEIVDHCVVVNANAGVIIDSCEPRSLVLRKQALRLCGGSSASNLRIAEVRFLVKQDEKIAKKRTLRD